MKNVLRLLILAAAFGAFALPALAQDAAAGGTAAASQQDEEAKTALYNKWRENRNGTAEQQKVAYEAGKEYLAKYGSQNDVYVQAVAKWVPKYEKAVRDFNFNKSLTDKNFQQAFTLGREILTAEPENLGVMIDLANAGYFEAQQATPNKALAPQTLGMLRDVIRAIEGNKTPQRLSPDGKAMVDSWAPFKSREEALGQFYYAQGFMLREQSPDEAAQSLIKAAQSNSSFKTEPRTFALLANAYLDGEYKRLINEYKTTYEGKDITEEMKPKYEELLARTNQVTDRIIDAWARAIALSANKPELKGFRDALLKQLTDVYKQRHDGKEDGLQQLIAGVLQRPMPLPGDPLPTPPANTTGSTGASAAGAAASTTPAAAKPATTGTKPRQ